MLVIAGYVFTWMRSAKDVPGKEIGSLFRPAVQKKTPDLFSRRFVWLTIVFLLLFIAASPLYLESAGVLALAAFIARAAAVTLRGLGLEAVATANVLSTSRGGFLVTQECISTPLIPVYFAAVFTYLDRWPPRVLAVLAAFPLFVGLGIARLLVVALPVALIGPPLFLIHAFYQLLLAAVVVVLAAFWRQGTRATAWRRAMIGALLGGVFVYFLGPLYARAFTSAFAGAAPLDDPQGAIAFLPPFQIGLYLALSVAVFVVFRWRPLVAGLALLALADRVLRGAALHRRPWRPDASRARRARVGPGGGGGGGGGSRDRWCRSSGPGDGRRRTAQH